MKMIRAWLRNFKKKGKERPKENIIGTDNKKDDNKMVISSLIISTNVNQRLTLRDGELSPVATLTISYKLVLESGRLSCC